MLEKFFKLLLLSKNFTREFADSRGIYKFLSQGSLAIHLENIYTLNITETTVNQETLETYTDIKQWIYKNNILELWRIRPVSMEKIFEFTEDNSLKSLSNPYFCGEDVYDAKITVINNLPHLKIQVSGEKKNYTLLYKYY